MHTNPDYNLLELDHTFTRLQQLNLQAGKKDVFLINTQKKKHIKHISLFSEILVREGFKTIHAPDDEYIFLALAALAYR